MSDASETTSPPAHWPPGVKQMTWDVIDNLGYHEHTGDLYWDGKRVETTLRLGSREKLLALIVAISTASMATVDLLRFAWGK